jgi:hypothetical protein
VSTFATYQINFIGAEGFKTMEVLLDNQANISIMRPELLQVFEHSENEIQVNGRGAVQLRVSETANTQRMKFR